MFALTIPKARRAPMPIQLRPEHRIQFNEYTELSKQIGLENPTPRIEAFQLFLVEHKIPIYNLNHVVRYMDRKAYYEAKRHTGWLWRPLRRSDYDLLAHNVPSFGTSAHQNTGRKIPASDYFGPHDGTLYAQQIPLDAVRKVALIEKEFGAGKVAFMVSDYAPYLESRPVDPFLMVCVPNRRIATEGRFVIAQWDEPGFQFEHIVPLLNV